MTFVNDAANSYKLGVMLRQLREQRGLTQAEVAERADISRQLLVKIEKGHPRAEIGRVLAVVRALGGRIAIEPITDSPPAIDLDALLEG